MSHPMRLVKLLVRPTSGSSEYGKVEGAYLSFATRAATEAEALSAAQTHALDRRWTVEATEQAIEVTPEREPELGLPELALCLKAEALGSAAVWAGWSSSVSQVEVRAFGDKPDVGGDGSAQ